MWNTYVISETVCFTIFRCDVTHSFPDSRTKQFICQLNDRKKSFNVTSRAAPIAFLRFPLLVFTERQKKLTPTSLFLPNNSTGLEGGMKYFHGEKIFLWKLDT